MIRVLQGNLFASDAEALVNTVNTVGVMGKGVALQFKERFPDNYHRYRKACKAGEVQIGKMFVTEVRQLNGTRWIINFPTKKHWRNKSEYGYITEGLEDLVRVVEDLNIHSIAIPPLGSGHGGLKWEKVKSLILGKLSQLDINIELYEPSFEPKSAPKKSNVGLTKPRALVLALLDRYRVLGFETTHLEIQKLAYFLQRMGQKDLRLQYKKFLYGPFAYNLQHLLNHLEGSYLKGDTRIMDTKPLDNIYLLKEKIPEITEYIIDHCSEVEKKRLERVYNLIQGFESPFGVELLSTVDWIVRKDRTLFNDPKGVMVEITNWNKRKASVIKEEHVQGALESLSRFSNELYVN